MKLAECLAEVALRFVYERGKPFSGNALADFIRRDLAQAAKFAVPFDYSELTVKASPGSGNWAAVPWVAFFDPLITTTAQEGFYVVFLINAQTSQIFLSLNQGTTAVYREFRAASGREVLARRAGDIRARIQDISRNFPAHQISLGSTDDLPLGYEAGHCIGKIFEVAEITKADLAADLREMLSIYRSLIGRGGIIPTDLMVEQAGTTDVVEARRYVLSQRIERSPNVRNRVLERLGLICQACGLDPYKDYGYAGRPENSPLDVHHISPLFELAEGEEKRYRIPADFFVLCPTCHRIIHTLTDPSDLEGLKGRIRFKHMRLIG